MGFAGISISLAAIVMRFSAVVRLGNATLLLAILLAGVAAVLDGREVTATRSVARQCAQRWLSRLDDKASWGAKSDGPCLNRSTPRATMPTHHRRVA